MSRARTFADLATAYGQGNALGKRNIAINGDMAISQRATSTTAVGATSSHYPTLDRYLYQANTSGRATVSQAAITDLAGFRFAQKIDVTTADTSIAAGEYFIINQMIEGFDVQRLQYGTSDDKTVTVSFYVKRTAKTYACEILTSASGTSKTFNVTTSWNRVSLTFPANTSDTVNQDNTNEFQLSIWLHAGSTYTGGTMSGAWGSTPANRAAGIGSIFSSTDNELFISGLQIETGDVVTPFEYESYETNLQRCQRYYHKIDATVVYTRYATGQAETTTQGEVYYEHPVEMRAKPSLGQTGTASNYAVYHNAGVIALSTVPVINSAQTKKMAVINPTVSSGMTQGEALVFLSNNNTDSYIEYIAEL